MVERIGFSRQFANRMLVLSVVIGVIISIAMPATYFFMGLRDRHRFADLRGAILADAISLAVHDNPELWYYDIPRFIEVGNRIAPSERIVAFRVYTNDGALAYENVIAAPPLYGMTTRTPILYNNRQQGTLEIEENLENLLVSTLLALGAFCLLGAILAFVVRSFPLRIVLSAESHIRSIVGELEASHRNLEQMAIRDPKTQLYNASYLMTALKADIERASREGEAICLLMIDIDYFKKYNDRHGHIVGDVLLTELAAILTRHIRSHDTVGRFGGEEFLIIMRDTDVDEAREVAQRLRQAVENHGFRGEDSQPRGKITISIGIAAYREGLTYEQFIASADEAMYAAKEAGRNQICFHGENTYELDGEKMIRVGDIAFSSQTIGQMIAKLENASREQIPSADVATLLGFFKALDSRESNTAQHSLIVNKIAMAIGRRLSLSAKELLQLNWGTLLHDIGKLAISDAILLKPGPLTPEEYETVKQHPVFGYDVLKNNTYLDNAIKIIRYHHERWDGNGYPYNLEGNQIPYLARICSVADAAAAMAEDRPYRKALAPAAIITEIARNSGTQFDPAIVAAFIRIADETLADLA